MSPALNSGNQNFSDRVYQSSQSGSLGLYTAHKRALVYTIDNFLNGNIFLKTRFPASLENHEKIQGQWTYFLTKQQATGAEKRLTFQTGPAPSSSPRSVPDAQKRTKLINICSLFLGQIFLVLSLTSCVALG